MKQVFKYEQAFPIAGKELAVPQPETFRTTMSRAFNFAPVPGQQWELVLTANHLERLEGMACCWLDFSVNPYDTLIRGIKRYGSVRVWLEYQEIKKELSHE